MTLSERKRVWKSFSPEKRAEIERRHEELLQRSLEEEEKLYEELKAQGKIRDGFDADPDEIIALHKKLAEDLAQLQREYGLA